MAQRRRIALYATTTLISLCAQPAFAAQDPAPQTQSASPTPAPADTTSQPTTAAATNTDDAIIVTARRREESIVDVPLAITVVTAKKLDQLNITSTRDLANFVPGLQFSDFTPGNSRNDRGGNRPLIFRGLNLSNNGGVTGAGSMFLDGAAVIGNEIPGGFDIGAVEVLRGPQNVYFGRASMTGAVSYRTKAIPKRWVLEAAATLAERGTHRVEASVAGPIAPGVLGARLTGLLEENDGFIPNAFTNGAGRKLGARSRQSISGTLDFTPVDALEVKLYANYFEDEDGMAATANIFPDIPAGQTNPPARLGRITNCLRGIAVGPGQGQQARPTICGEVPGPENAINYSNTIIPARDAAALFGIPFLQSAKFKQQVGMQRNVFNSHAVVNLKVNDYLKFQSITGLHANAVQQVGDGIQQPVIGLRNASTVRSTYSVYFYNLANKFKDFSQEFRLSSNPEKAFSWTVGANYVNARNQGTAVVTFTGNPASVTDPLTGITTFPTPSYLPFPQNLGDDRAKTYGVFAGAYLKLLDDRMTLSAEGRYQVDKRRTITRNSGGILLSDVKGNFKSFNPRVSLDYDVGGKRKIYVSYAKGSRPGGFNAGLLVYYDPTNPIYTRTTPAPLNFAAVTQSITDTFGVTDPTYKEEKLTIGEIGFKGNIGGGKGYFDINAYYGVVSNQQIRKSLLVPALGFSLGAVTNTGETEIYGVEWSGNWNFSRQISLATTFAWNHTNRKIYLDKSPGTLQIYGFSDFSGLRLPNTPEYSGSAVLAYEDVATDRWSPFGNVALVYRGKQWADLGNFAYIKGRTTIDVRVGAKTEQFRLEAFVTNLTNNKTYPGGNVAPDFGGNPYGQFSGFFGAFAEPRTFGGRVSAKF